jgi:hypothetical protein
MDFMGMSHDGSTLTVYKVGPLNPDWVQRFFKGVYMQLVMLRPNTWWPMVIRKARNEDDVAPTDLLTSGIKVRYQQFDFKQCLIMEVAPSLYYGGLIKEAHELFRLAPTFELLTESIALKELKRTMQKCIPYIGDCEIFNVRNAKKRTIRKLSVEDLIGKKTRFPTIVIVPWGGDGGNNHSFVVIDDLIFNST